jgi:hypothetical protein
MDTNTMRNYVAHHINPEDGGKKSLSQFSDQTVWIVNAPGENLMTSFIICTLS